MIQRVVALGLLAAVLILPLCLIYASSSVYLKLLLLNTQPLVSFTGRWVVKLSSATTTVTGCSDQRFLQMMPNSRIFAVASRAVDNDHDGYPDIVSVNASTILLPREQILSVRAAFEIEYQVAGPLRLLRKGLLIVDYSSPIPGAGLIVEGHLQIHSRSTLIQGIDLASQDSPLDFTRLASVDTDSLNWHSILRNYHDMQTVATIAPADTLWRFPRADADPFILSLNIRIGQLILPYQPSLLPVLKDAWIQYIALMALVLLIVGPLYKFMLNNHIIARAPTAKRTHLKTAASY